MTKQEQAEYKRGRTEMLSDCLLVVRQEIQRQHSLAGEASHSRWSSEYLAAEHKAAILLLVNNRMEALGDRKEDAG